MLFWATTPRAHRIKPQAIAKKRGKHLTFIRLPLIGTLSAVAVHSRPKERNASANGNSELELIPFLRRPLQLGPCLESTKRRILDSHNRLLFFGWQIQTWTLARYAARTSKTIALEKMTVRPTGNEPGGECHCFKRGEKLRRLLRVFICLSRVTFHVNRKTACNRL